MQPLQAPLLEHDRVSPNLGRNNNSGSLNAEFTIRVQPSANASSQQVQALEIKTLSSTRGIYEQANKQFATSFEGASNSKAEQDSFFLNQPTPADNEFSLKVTNELATKEEQDFKRS